MLKQNSELRIINKFLGSKHTFRVILVPNCETPKNVRDELCEPRPQLI